MEIVALFGAGPKDNAFQIIQEINNFWPTTSIEAIFFNDSTVWGMELFGEYIIQRPSNIVNYQFEKLIICADPVLCQAIIPVLVEKLGLEEDRVIPYYKWMRFNIGIHQIDWNKVYRISDIIEELQKCNTLNDLEEFYYNKPHRIVGKYAHYLEIYDRHFQKYRNTECVIVEIGVYKGGSLQMWKDYFGEKAQIIGIDIDESTVQYMEDQITIKIGSQSDREFWKKFKEDYPKVDILIDDGGHTMEQQIITFEEMFEHISEEGVYLCEDLHTSYWEGYYGGGYRNPESFIEYSKKFIDYINIWYNQKIYENNYPCYTHTMHSLHYYDSILVIEKHKMHRGVCLPTGQDM